MNITRHQQLLSNIKRLVSTVLREIDHEALHMAVVTDVILSNDGRECRIWVDAPEATVTLLNTTFRREIQYNFMKQYARKIVPHLSFHQDKGEMDRMDALLAEQERQDATDKTL